ncbi:MAG: hypothetical protein ACI84R_001690 [Candidatus Azotimanducaceae bacterium]|jgi:hypothetical protein
MASGISGKFTLNLGEIWCGDDDRAPDVLEWIYLFGWLHVAQLQRQKNLRK